ARLLRAPRSRRAARRAHPPACSARRSPGASPAIVTRSRRSLHAVAARTPHPVHRTRSRMGRRADRGRGPRCRAVVPAPTTRSRRTMSGRIRVAIAGVGNCASSLVQGVEYYRNADPSEDVPGLMHVVLGGYHVGDVDFVAAFDVDAAKVGLDLGKAISAGQNNTIKFANVGQLEVEVQRAPTFDGLGKYYRETVEE